MCDMLGARGWSVWSDRGCQCGESCDWANRAGRLEKDIVFHGKLHALYSKEWNVPQHCSTQEQRDRIWKAGEEREAVS